MKKLIYALLAVAGMVAACIPPGGGAYPRVTIEVSFLDGTKDTMTISERYHINPEGVLREIARPYQGPSAVATGVKYVKILEP